MAKRTESPSSINTYKQCPRKYYYQYIARLPTLPSIHTLRGNIVHEILENFYNIDVSLFSEDYHPRFHEAILRLLVHHWKLCGTKFDGLRLSDDQKKFYFEETLMMLNNWINHLIEDIKEVMASGQIDIREAFTLLTPIREQELSSQKLSVRGFIDAIHLRDDEVIIVDYKTNNTSEMKESIMLQLGIYCLLYEELYGRRPDKVGVFFLRDKLKITRVDSELLNIARKEIEFVHSQTMRGEDIALYERKLSPLCRWSSGQCDFYDVCRPHEPPAPAQTTSTPPNC